MLITLQSNNNGDASDFVNYFKETVMIEPKSELSLVNISYKFENGITITTGVNDEFSVSLGQDNVLGVAVVPAGEYATDADFATACETALHGLINTLPYWKTQAFPLSSQTFTVEGASTDRLKITLQYDPQEWDNSLILNATAGNERKQVFGNNNGILPDFNKGIIKRITGGVGVGAYNTDNWNSGTGVDLADTNVMWATARDTTQAVQHGKIAWKGYRTDSVEWVVGATDGPIPSTPAEWLNGTDILPIAVRCMANGNLRISERSNTGVLATIKDNVPVADFDDIEIHFDQMTSSSGETYAKYYVGGAEVVIDPAADRWVLRPGLEMVPCGSFKTPYVANKILDGGGTFAVPSCVKTFSFTAGSGYYNGEIVSIEATSGSTTTGLITTNAAGEILTLSFQEHGGNFDSNVDNAQTITGLMSGKTSATFNCLSVDNSIVITNGGTNYNTNNADIVFNGITYTDAINIIGVDAGGVIQDFEWLKFLENEGIAVGDVLEVHEGGHTDARLSVEAVDAESNLIYGVITDTIERDVDEPLGLHNRATFRPSAGFSLTTSMNAVGPAPALPLTTTGSGGINDGREDTVMLVNIEEFMLKSICKDGGIQKAIASVPYGLTQPYFESGDPVKVDGEFYYEPYNMLYHALSNPGVENHNQLRVRLTDAVGNPIKQLQHPTTLTLDLRPRAK